MGELPEGGAMVAIEATEAEAKSYLEGKEQELSIAAVNAPPPRCSPAPRRRSKQPKAHFEAEGKKTKRLAVSHAFHSPLIEPMLDQFAEVAKTLTYQEPQIPIVSNQSGEILDRLRGSRPRLLGLPRQRAGALRGLDRDPGGAGRERPTWRSDQSPALSPMAAATLRGRGTARHHDPHPERGTRGEAEALIGALAGAHAHGRRLDWETFFKGTGAKRVPLPTYPFQRKRYWLEGSANGGDPTAIGQADAEHPLLGAALVELAEGRWPPAHRPHLPADATPGSKTTRWPATSCSLAPPSSSWP